jgi:hypothetical protein
VSQWVWLVAALVAAAGAYLVGAPAWSSYRSHAVRDLNAERYLAWRGRADRKPVKEEGTTREERGRMIIAAVLAVVAVFCLVGFFTYL